MKVLVMRTGNEPIIIEGVVQIDYTHYKRNKYAPESLAMSVVISSNGTKKRLAIDITPDVQVIILYDKEVAK